MPPHSPRPAAVQMLCDQGATLCRRGRLDEAKACYDRALALRPEDADARNRRGRLLHKMRCFDDARADLARAVALDSGHAEAWYNHGDALRELGRFDEALASYDRAIALNPNVAEPHHNRGVVLHLLRRFDDALASFQRATTLNPRSAAAFHDQSLTLLVVGRFKAGWPQYEFRKVGQPANPYGLDPNRQWRGEPNLRGRRLFVHHEQGLGDTIQFCRYVQLLGRQGVEVAFSVQAPLKRLLQSLGPNVTVCGETERPESHDYHCALLSLPLAFKTTLQTIPRTAAYLHADPAKGAQWRDKLGSRRRTRIGLVWNGGFRPDSPESWSVNERRNIPFALLAQLNNERFDFFSLQKGEAAEAELAQARAADWPEANLFNFSRDFRDFSDTAGLIDNLDLVISVDTSTAHLAGAMGKPVWILNRFDACWRWLDGRDDSPWYPSARLFRQPRPGDWPSVIAKVKAELAKLG